MKLRNVNGFKIRNTIDPNFCVVGSQKTYPYIPSGEIWFDNLYSFEKQHFLRIHLYELKLMKKMSYETARKIIEKKFRLKTNNLPNFVIKTKRYKGYLIKYVDGRVIRKYIDPKFVLGCHFVISKNNIKREIWIDVRQDKREYKYTLLHEHKEAELMKKGMSYNNAHDFALAEEKMARRKDGYGGYLTD